MFQTRLQKIREKLQKEKLDAVWVSDVSNITYLSGYANFSKREREAYIFIGRNFGYLISDGRYTEAVKDQVPHLEFFERSYQSPLENLFKKHKVLKLGIEENNLTVSEYKFLKKHFKNTKHFETSRTIKTEEEINKIKKACEIGDKTFKYILKKIEPGISEKKLAFEIEMFIKSQGAKLSFPPIVAFGKNSAVPHHQTGETVLGSASPERGGQFILLDFGVKFENYCSDMTRTVFFGKPTGGQKKIYETVLEAQQKAVNFLKEILKSGKEVSGSKVDRVARDYIISQPVTPEVSIQATSGVATYPDIPHSLGHGIGLEVHEHPSLSPKSKDILREGMVFSIEPGIYLSNFSSPRLTRIEVGGVRIEDLFVIQENTLKQLTHSPKDLIVVY